MSATLTKASVRRPVELIRTLLRGQHTATEPVNELPRPLYLDPHKWIGLPADRVFELHNLRVTNLGEKYVPNNVERRAILSTIASLLGGKPKLEYGYEIDNFKERIMNNTPLKHKGLPPKLSNWRVFDKGETSHQMRLRVQSQRIAAFEMPLLAKYRQPYRPADRLKSPLQLTFQTDFSDTPNEYNAKVKLTVKLEDLQLDQRAAKRFILLSDKKFNHHTGIMTFSCARFPESAQNARWLVETFNTLLRECKNPKNDFSDIPVNTCQRKAPKPTTEFPESWKKPEDAPVQRHQIVQSYIQSYKERKDSEYLKAMTP